LGKRHLFCPSCGNKVEQVVREKVEQRRQRREEEEARRKAEQPALFDFK